MLYLIFFGELILLFILSQTLSKSLSQVIYMLTHSVKMTVYGIALLFFPGTLIHEIAHYFVAALLHVPVGEMKLFPEMHEDGVKLGSVQIAKTDPFRRAIIGVAPFIVGMSILLSMFYSFLKSVHSLPWWALILGIYVVFEIANTMFSSKKDLEGTIELSLALIVITIVLYLLGVRIPPSILQFLASDTTLKTLRIGTFYVAIPLGVDVLTIMLMKGIIRGIAPRHHR